MQRDSIANTFVVAVTLCVVCAVMVAGAAVGLREYQNANKLLDRQRNVLLAAGLIDRSADGAKVRELFESRVSPVVVDLTSGSPIDGVDPDSLDPLRDSKSSDESVRTALAEDPARLKARENKTVVYRILKEGSKDEAELYVFPIRGYGLWSTLFGFLALEADLKTVKGITYYQHGETPGLGGEVDNPNWKQGWVGKRLYDDSGAVALKVVKGGASPGVDTEIDGLSGASITAKGVENMIHFWFGPMGFRTYINGLQPAAASAATAG